MRQIFSSIWRVVLDGFFPAYCLGCKTEGEFLCAGCAASFERLENQVCPWCYERSDLGVACDSCVCGERFLDGVLASAQFEEHSVLQRAIHAFKYDFLEDLREPLGGFLMARFADLLRRFPEKKFVLCPLPLHKRRLLWRGFNQAEKLCQVLMHAVLAAGFANVAMRELLERVHFSRPQMELDREARLTNVREAFRVLRTPEDACVVLVDDIATTLSTLNSAAAALKKAGVQEVYGLVLARVF